MPAHSQYKKVESMKRLTISFLITLAVLLGSVRESFALPRCEGSYNANTWMNCFGTHTHPEGFKYVGEFKNGNQHGQGIPSRQLRWIFYYSWGFFR